MVEQEKPISCLKCVKVSVHPSYPSIVICLKDNKVIPLRRETCRDYVERGFDELVKTLSEHGFLYCVDCHKPIYSIEELYEHLHDIVLANYPPDEVAHEESPAAD
ncbi:MAG: hypothetical protein N3F65_00445 [Nitrososphaeria archaeon]|nr:hypothetical protein [Aigarchaeota archaeon]MCX8187068.1 hypothetical protein [Nitrososphaeria archaeon]MDW8021646.1 hypothetical protein [Nitrososphaerota archaeon]